jgi:type I restriction enzyme, S subunit
MEANGKESWKPEKLVDLCDHITDGKHGDCQDEPDSGFYFLSCKDVANGKLNYEGARQITEADFLDTHRRTKFAPTDVLITNSGTIGRMAIAPDNELTHRTTFQKSVAILKPIPSRIEPRFLYYAIQGDIRRLIEFAGGTAQKNLLLRDLRAFEVSVPPLAVQRRIAGILSAYDELMENSQRRIRILEMMARALYREWFVHFRFPGHEKRRRVASPLGDIPQGWEVEKLGGILELNYGKALKKEERRDGPFPVFGSSGIVGHHDSSLVKGPGIIVGRKGNVGSVFWCDEDFFVIDTAYFVTSSLPLRFLFYVLPTLNFLNSDAAVPGLSRNQAYTLEIILPPAPLLNRFCELADTFERQASTLQRQIQNLHRTRDLLLPRLLSGQLNLKEN